jgi:hypothetical protein
MSSYGTSGRWDIVRESCAIHCQAAGRGIVFTLVGGGSPPAASTPSSRVTIRRLGSCPFQREIMDRRATGTASKSGGA